MKEEITAFELGFLAEELQELADAKIEKIFHVLPKEIVLQLHLPNIGRKILRISPNFIYLASQKSEMPEKPSNFCSYLRKYLENARIRSIVQRDFERIVEIALETREKKYVLVAELFDKGNVILCDERSIFCRQQRSRSNTKEIQRVDR